MPATALPLPRRRPAVAALIAALALSVGATLADEVSPDRAGADASGDAIAAARSEVLAPSAASGADEGGTPRLHEYPTVAIADYVLGCMVANGNTYLALEQCSCSIDFIRARIDFPTYERVATIMQIQLDRGQRGAFYRDSNWAKNHLESFENVQAESTLQCF